MSSLYKKLMVWLARRQLQNAVRYEAELRDSVAYMRSNIIPKLESELRSREVDFFMETHWGVK